MPQLGIEPWNCSKTYPLDHKTFSQLLIRSLKTSYKEDPGCSLTTKIYIHDCLELIVESGLINSIYLVICRNCKRYYFCLHFSWKDQTNEYRTHPKLRLTGVPTLLQWDTVSIITLNFKIISFSVLGQRSNQPCRI